VGLAWRAERLLVERTKRLYDRSGLALLFRHGSLWHTLWRGRLNGWLAAVVEGAGRLRGLRRVGGAAGGKGFGTVNRAASGAVGTGIGRGNTEGVARGLGGLRGLARVRGLIGDRKAAPIHETATLDGSGLTLRGDLVTRGEDGTRGVRRPDGGGPGSYSRALRCGEWTGEHLGARDLCGREVNLRRARGAAGGEGLLRDRDGC
jgi:hypothetical protein